MSNPFLHTESFEDVSTILEKIKQSRDRYKPSSVKWERYIIELFQTLGFSIQEMQTPISILSYGERDQSPKAVAVFIQPGESLEDLIAGLSWETFMLYATSFYKVEWAIFTDGLQLKVVQFQGSELKQRLYWQDLDQIICQQRVDEFLAILLVMNIIKKAKTQTDVQPLIPDSHLEKSKSLADAKQFVVIQNFLKELLEKSKSKTSLHAKVSLGAHNYFAATAGKKGLRYGYIMLMDQGIVNLYIDNGETDWNKSEFTRLYEHKTNVEETFGESLEWQLMPRQKSSYIRYTISGFNLRNLEIWGELQDKLIDAMIRLERAFRPYIIG